MKDSLNYSSDKEQVTNNIFSSVLSRLDPVFDPSAWALENLGVQIYDNQIGIFTDLPNPAIPCMFIAAARGSGKSMCISIGIAKFCYEYVGLQVGVFGPKAEQALRLLAELRKWVKGTILEGAIDLVNSTKSKIIFKNGSQITALSANEVSMTEGWHFHCFTPDTLIALANGSFIPIEQITPEKDCIISFDPLTKLKKINLVLQKHELEAPKELFEIIYRVKQKQYTTRCTKDHKFITFRGEVEAQNLEKGDILYSLWDGDIVFGKILSVKPVFAKINKVYDLTIDKNPYYFANSALVHNCVVLDECLHPESLVFLTDGTQQSIKQIVEEKAVEKVLSYDESLGTLVFSKILDYKTIELKKEMFEIEVSDGKNIKCTSDHKFFANQSWVKAEDLKKTDFILDLDLQKLQVKSIKKIKSDTKYVYDLTVEKTHCYFANNILVHNCHKIADVAVNQKIIPMLGSYEFSKVIKLGVTMYKNQFYKSFQNPIYKKYISDWLHCPILLRGGSEVISGIIYPTGELKSEMTVRNFEVPKYVLNQMPLSLKVKVFPNHPLLHYEGTMSEIDFMTQYMMLWLDDILNEYSEEDQQKIVGEHLHEERGTSEGVYIFSLDTASGTIADGQSDLDFTHLGVWKRTPDGRKFKMNAYEWQGDPLSQIEEILHFIDPKTSPFHFKVGMVDYSNIGVPIVEVLKRAHVSIVPIMFGRTEPSTGANWKNALADHFKMQLKDGMVKYPNLEEINKIPIFKKSYNEFCSIERRRRASRGDQIQAPTGSHDDGWCSDIMAAWAADKCCGIGVASKGYTPVGASMPSLMHGGATASPIRNKYLK